MGYLWLVGVVLVAAASAGSTIGIILMKKSFGETGEHETLQAKLVWVAGLGLMVSGAILDFVAFGFAAQSLIAPLGSVTLLCNVVLSPLMLGEKVSKSDWVASGIIALGCTVAIAFGDHETKTYKFDDLMDLYDSTAVVVYLPAISITITGMFLYTFLVERPANQLAHEHIRQLAPDIDGVEIGSSPLKNLGNLIDDEQQSGMDVVLPGGFLMGFNPNDVDQDLERQTGAGVEDQEEEPLSPMPSGKNKEAGSCNKNLEITPQDEITDVSESEGVLSPQVVLPFIPMRLHMIHGFCYAAAGGLAGSCSVLFGKSVAEIIKPGFTDGDGSAWGRVETYLILVAMGCTLFVQMKGLNLGLGFHPAVFIVPVYQTCWILGSIVGGGVYFKEFSNMSALQVTMFCLGTGICLGGVFVLTYCRWDAEMEKYRAEMGLGSRSSTPVQTLRRSDVEKDSTEKGTSTPSTLPSMGTGLKIDVAPENTENSAHINPNSTNPNSTNESLESMPKSKGKNSLPPLPSPKSELPVEESKAARNAMRKKRMLRKKQSAGCPELGDVN